MYHSLKLLGSRYAFTCCRTLLANRRDIVFHPPYKVFSRVFLFIKASMKLVGRMHHHKYNGMDFACMECILHSYFFFPPPYFLRPIFLDIDRLYIFYKISFFLVRVTELRGISWWHLNFFFLSSLPRVNFTLLIKVKIISNLGERSSVLLIFFPIAAKAITGIQLA